jgi:hypothetical protein
MRFGPSVAVAVAYDFRADPILGNALRYWECKRGDRRMPSRRDLDPTEIPRLLSHLQMIDVIDYGARFRYRLVGTTLVETFGFDYTGRFADELFSGVRRDFVQNIYRTVCDERCPVFLHNVYQTVKHYSLVGMRLFLPLSNDDEEVNIILSACRIELPSGAAGAWGTAIFDTTQYHMEIVDPTCPARLNPPQTITTYRTGPGMGSH